MKILRSIPVGAVLLSSAGVVSAQSGHMTNGGMGGFGWMGGYGGIWLPIVVVVVVAALVAWVVSQKGK